MHDNSQIPDRYTAKYFYYEPIEVTAQIDEADSKRIYHTVKDKKLTDRIVDNQSVEVAVSTLEKVIKRENLPAAADLVYQFKNKKAKATFSELEPREVNFKYNYMKVYRNEVTLYLEKSFHEEMNGKPLSPEKISEIIDELVKTKGWPEPVHLKQHLESGEAFFTRVG